MPDGFGEFLKRSAHDLLNQDEVVALKREMDRGTAALESLDAGAFDGSERARLLATVRRGQSAKQRLLLHNLRLVLSISSRYHVDGLTPEDLFQEGVLGLHRAIEKFDPDKGWRLSTYATWWIRQSVERAVADKARLIRLPVHVHERVLKLSRKRAALVGEKGWASLDDLVDATGFQPSVVRQLLQLMRGYASLDEVVGDGLTTLGDLQVDRHNPGPEEQAITASVAAEVDSLLAGLPERQAEVVRLRFGVGEDAPLTLEEVGNRYGLTRERVRQIEANAMERLRRLAGVPATPPEDAGGQPVPRDRAGVEGESGGR